jgi:hypothetical protein
MIAKERHLARAYRRLTIREISHVLGTSSPPFRTIFPRRFWHETYVSEVSPTAANSGVEGAPPVLANDLFECSKTDKNFFRNILTDDETLV